MSIKKLIEVRQVTYRYGRDTIINGLDLVLNKGEVTGLLGTNGAGKSTTLKLLSGQLTPDSGTILFDGNDIHRSPQQARQQTGYLPENAELFPGLSVDEHLDYAASLHGLTANDKTARIDQVKKDCQLEQHGSKLASSLSKGYRQRLAIALALIHKPSLVLLDEPASGLDPLQNRELRELISKLRQDAAIFLSTHNLADIKASCDRVLIMRDGHIVHSQTVDNNDASLDQAFLKILSGETMTGESAA